MRFRFTLILLTALIALGISLASAAPFKRVKFDRSRFDRTGTTTATTPAPAPVVVEEKAPSAEPTGGSSWQGGSEPTGGSSWQTGAPASTNQGNRSWQTGTGTSSGGNWQTGGENADGSGLSGGPPPPKFWPGVTAEEMAAYHSPLWDEVPGKWFKKSKQFEELQALQKKTGACMIIYFKNPTVPNQKGLCNWYEKTVTKNMKWRKAMRHYIKLEITQPGTKVTKALTEQMRANKSPNVTVLHPGAPRGTRLNLFDYPKGSRPVPIEAEQVLLQLKEASTPAYATIIE